MTAIGTMMDQAKFTEATDALATARQALIEQGSQIARVIRDTDPMPQKFVGIINEYRYTTGRKGEMPSHRFYLECGRGVWVYANCPSAEFEQMMRDQTIDLVGGSLDGEMIVCTANATINAIVPTEFVTPLGCNDRFGNYLYVDCPVMIDSGGTLRSGVAKQYFPGDGLVQVELAEGDEYVNVSRSAVTRAI